MSNTGYVFRGEVGDPIRIDTKIDLTNADLKIEVKKPDGTIVTWDGTTSDNQRIVYEYAAGDFDQIGRYELQPRAEWDLPRVKYGPKVFIVCMKVIA
jgi:hypothetical protein